MYLDRNKCLMKTGIRCLTKYEMPIDIEIIKLTLNI